MKIKNKNKGFTLIEVLIATFVMLVTIGAIASIEVFYLNYGFLSKRELQARQIAEQTFELVRLIRDKNVMPDPAADSLPDCADPDAQNPPVGCFPNAKPPSGYDASTRIQDGNPYAYTTVNTANVPDVSNPTKFGRRSPAAITLDGKQFTVIFYIYKN